MLSKEIKKLVDVSEGKIILSEGDLDKSYVVMKLNKYLEEKNVITEKKQNKDELINKNKGLTDKSFLDKMSVDVEAIRKRERDKELEGDFLEKKTKEEFDYDYSN